MTKKQIIDIDAEFDGVEFDEKEIRRFTGYLKSASSHRGQKRTDEQKHNMSTWQKGKSKSEDHKEKIGDAFRGKTLEEILGEERAAEGREARRQACYRQDYTGRGEKIAATRRANGSYENNGMTGKQHKESTKAQQSMKAQIRQDIKRELGLGRSDSIPKDILERAYKRAGLL